MSKVNKISITIMIFNIIKFGNIWCIVPPRNNNDDIINLYTKLGITKFMELCNDLIVNDDNGKPNILQASKITRTYTTNEEITFELFELL